MPIQMQCCGLLLMLIILFFYKSQKTIKLNTEKAFLKAFYAVLISLVLDIGSCILIVFRYDLPTFPVYFVCKAYLISMIVMSQLVLSYIFADKYSRESRFRVILIRQAIFSGVGILLIIALPIYIYCDVNERLLYTYGPCVNATFLFAALTIVMIVIQLIRSRKVADPRRLQAVALWMSCWIVALVIQFINRKLLLAGFASALGILILYLKMENPSYNIDRQTGLFNQNAFTLYAEQLYANGKSFSAFEMIFGNGSFRGNKSQEDSVIAEVISYLSQNTTSTVFKGVGNELLLMFCGSPHTDSEIEMILERFNRGWGKDRMVFLNPVNIYIPDSTVAGNINEYLYFMRYVEQHQKEYTDNKIIVADQKAAKKLRDTNRLDALIRRAIDEDSVEVFYQPIYSTKERRFVSAEALVRIRDENGDLVPPGLFIPVAESNGLILELGEMVFRNVCRFIDKHDIKKLGLEYIEVNLSVVQCAYEHLASDYIEIMKKNKVKPGYINLEITESASLNAKKILLENMKELMNFGVSFSLDDFGTGQSNLNYIMEMPVNIVKFDRDMTNAYFENGKAKYIMDAAMNMIHGMDLHIVSEGVETMEQFSVMEELGINYIQGYYFSKPLPEQEFVEFLKAKQPK